MDNEEIEATRKLNGVASITLELKDIDKKIEELEKWQELKHSENDTAQYYMILGEIECLKKLRNGEML